MKIYEHHSEPLISTWKFVRRVVLHHIVGVLVFALILAAGIAVLMLRHGFLFEDAVMEASMLSTGMGPVNSENIHTADGKYFVSLYAIFCRFGLVAAIGIPLIPILHRLLHITFHKCDGVQRGTR
jgi:hypothetical protein